MSAVLGIAVVIIGAAAICATLILVVLACGAMRIPINQKIIQLLFAMIAALGCMIVLSIIVDSMLLSGLRSHGITRM